MKAEEKRDYMITVWAIYGNPITGNCGISGLRVNGDIILECKYILPTNYKTLDMIPFFPSDNKIICHTTLYCA